MITLKVFVNGQLRNTCGTENMSSLTAIVSAVGKLGPKSAGAKGNRNDYRLKLELGGLTSNHDKQLDEFVHWIEGENLNIRDEIKIVIGEEEKADSPKSSKPAYTEDDEIRKFEWAKNYYLENKIKFQK